jgi:toxin ParE1/3/4
MARLRLTARGERDIAELLGWSQQSFGPAARRRYEALIAAALRDIAQDWRRVGSVQRGELGAGRLVYHLRHSRERARIEDGVVQAPRHFVVYRQFSREIVVVLRVLHEAMDLRRRLDAPRE